jgi:chromosome segregation ATPase
MFRFIVFMAAMLPLAAQAQVTYRCTGKDGKKYYGSTIPMQCAGEIVEQLNSQGRVVKRIDPDGRDHEKKEKEALAKKKEEDPATREEQRRNRALLATYTSERDIEDARQRALADNQKAVTDVQTKIEAIKKSRAKYEKELEFYKDSKKGAAKPPAKLAQDIANADIDLKAQEDLLAVKQKEVATINAKYDEDKKRYIELRKKGTTTSSR